MAKKSKMIICVVDDDPIFHYVCKVNLAALCKDLDFISFYDGKEALAYFMEQNNAGNVLPNVLLVDINMPLMNGWELVDHLSNQQLLTNSKLYIVSSSVSPEDSFRSLSKKEVDSYLTKPLIRENFMQICWTDNHDDIP
ncbi:MULTISPECIES: response regulator [Sphingobacterium]|uniref:Two-component system response regulator n=1 Tax=Sphingobacterium populi TaxID=1812824 RepID=A0ABW5UGA9_9SPHI|nr:response regulator [Sphingobacterium sp. CFCC 11742]